MPLRPLRPGRSDKDLKRRSTLDPAGLFTRGSKTNKSAEHLTDVRHAVSEDGGARPLSGDEPRESLSPADNNHHRPRTPVQEHSPMTRRFSMMRFRHASDSQLSTRAKEQQQQDDTPPVPQVPANATSSMLMSCPIPTPHMSPC